MIFHGLKLKEQISNEIKIIHLLDEAAFTEKFLSKPKPPHAPSMYDLITTSYTEDEVGYYKKELKHDKNIIERH